LSLIEKSPPDTFFIDSDSFSIGFKKKEFIKTARPAATQTEQMKKYVNGESLRSIPTKLESNLATPRETTTSPMVKSVK
jgi:hypothetical protein